MNERAKWGVVAVLAVVWAALFVIRLVDQPTPQRVPLMYRSGQSLPPESVRSRLGMPTVVRPVRSQAAQASFQIPKNIFAPLESQRDESGKAVRARALTAKNAPPPAVATPVPVPTPPAVPVPSAEELSAQQAQQAIAQYRFLGYLTQAGKARAFLGKGQQIFIVTAGDLLEERLRVQAITASAVQLRDAGTSVEGTIPLSAADGRGF